MAAKRNKKGQEPARGPERDEAIKTTSEYYRLKTKAVEDLVTANAQNSPKVSRCPRHCCRRSRMRSRG